MKYVSLHHHSTYSYMDGYGPVRDHVARAAELGMGAQALTEHGNVSSHVQLEKEAAKAGIKPIFGLEAYCAPENMRDEKNRRKWHLTLLAENQEGYRNLMRIVTKSWAEGFYQWPTVHGRWLQEHSEGIIALSGCADSHLSCTLLGGKGRETGDEREALAVMRNYKRIFGDRYYVETQMFPELERTRTLNPWFETAARRFGVPLVATADCHYPTPTDNKMQAILHTAGRGLGNVDTAESQWEYDILLTHPTSDALVKKRLGGTGLSRRGVDQAFASTVEIADRCNVTLPKVEMLKYPLPRGVKSGEELIWDWLREGWRLRWRENKNMRADKKKYWERIKYEMKMIIEKGYVDYFLMVSDATRWCKDRGYENGALGPLAVGPARGSAAASLVCYVLRITEIDPLPFPNMLFERFIDVTRTDLPDIDLDFDDERRGELVQHIVDLYGSDRVANIGTYTKYRGKNSLDDVARAFTIPAWEIQPIKDLMIERSGGDSRLDSSLEDTVGMFEAASAVLEKNPDLKYALRLEGNYKSMSVHSAGLVISNAPLSDNVATYTRTTGTGKKKRTRQVVSVDKYDAEYLGMLKADFLGLTTMGMIGRALREIGMSLQELYTIELDDPEVLEAFKTNDVSGIFQFGGGATKIVNGDVKPDNFLELCDINALSRPGPLHSGTTQDYISIKHGRKQPDHLHPIIDKITQYTNYCIIYQEQILQIIREIGGLPWTHIQEIRKIISLKKGEGAFNERYRDFIDGAAKLHGLDEGLADRIWKRLVTAGQYAFNASHCVSYSMLAYWQMWLKVHHPHAYYAACLAKFKKQEYILLRDAIRHGLTILPPDLRKSGVTWAVDGDAVRAGFTQIPGIGEVQADAIIASREEDGPFKDWRDLIRVKGIGGATADKIESFAKAEDPFQIHRVDKVLNEVRKAISSGRLMMQNEKGRMIPLPSPKLKGADIPTDATNFPVTYIGIPRKRNPQDVIEDERARTGKSIEEVTADMKDPHLSKKMTLECFDDSDVLVYVRFSRWDFPRFEEQLWDLDLDHDVLLIKGVKKGGFGTGIHVKAAWCINPDDLFETDEEEDEFE
jgi:DNA polymerase-3 subunit alpha